MKLSPHEWQILDEIQQGLRAEDPEFVTSMRGSRRRRGRFVWGWGMFLLGLAAFMVAAIIAQVMPGAGFFVSLAASMTMFWGLALLCSGNRSVSRDGPDSELRRRAVRLWDSIKDPPPPGMSP